MSKPESEMSIDELIDAEYAKLDEERLNSANSTNSQGLRYVEGVGMVDEDEEYY